ncbi:hypothetical protein KIPB_011201, partial [Kipferlia bialata]|eukprot:g11201.t1
MSEPCNFATVPFSRPADQDEGTELGAFDYRNGTISQMFRRSVE